MSGSASSSTTRFRPMETQPLAQADTAFRRAFAALTGCVLWRFSKQKLVACT